MRKILVEKIIAAALALIMGLSPLTGFAQTNQEPWSKAASSPLDVKGFDKSIFDYHFSRADRELNPGRWIFEARRGIGLAMNAWELFASSFYENPLLMEGAKKQIEEWSEEELEERFTQWLASRFFGDAAEQAASLFSGAVGETNLRYTYHQDTEGNIVYDDQTGDPLVIRPGEDGREFSLDLSLWRNAVEQNVETGTRSFEAVITRMYPELLAYVPPEMRESLGAKIAAAGSEFSGRVRKEFEQVAAREERLFTGRRTGDVWSLRKKSDDEAARLITVRLIGEAEDVCARGIAGLAGRIEEASTGNGDLVLMGTEWLQMYREQFDRGLKAWEQAEERFFIRRIEWEQESGRLFSRGEESWLAAFEQFENERKKWELQTRELFESGEALFRNASENLERSIIEAKMEFERDFQMRMDAGTGRAKALIDMYLTCGSGAAAAKENIQFWLKQYGGGSKPDPASPAFGAWLDNEIKKQSSSSLLKEIKKSHDLYVSYLDKAKDAREKLIADYDGLIGTGALKDILSDDVSSEDFSLDEYQTALIKAKALVQYWERRTAIAEAVSGYAKDLTAGRITDAEGLKAWEAAKAAYNESLDRYERELQSLNAIGADLRNKQAALDELALEMKEAEEALSVLNKEYSILIAANAVNRENHMLAEFNVKYADLLAEYRLLALTGNGALYNNSLEYALELGIAGQRETAGALRDMLINGDGEDLESLAALEEAAAADPEAEMALRVRLSGIDLLNAETGADWYCGAWGTVPAETERAELKGKKLRDRLIADTETGDLFSGELLALYENLGGAAAFALEEAWQDTLQDLGLLFASYGLAAPASSLPDVQSLCAALSARPGDFAHNIAGFFREFDRCFSLIPEWLEYEVNGWKNAFAEYAALDALYRGKTPAKNTAALALEYAAIENRYQALEAYYASIEYADAETIQNIQQAYAAISEDEILLFYKDLVTEIWEQNSREAADAEREKNRHWRQYLADEYLNEPDPLLVKAASWKEGILLDALNSAAMNTGFINDAFALYASHDRKKNIRDTDFLLDNIENENGFMESHLDNAAVLREELARLGRGYEYTRMAPDVFRKELERQYTALKDQEAAFNTLRDSYLHDAEAFAVLGARYDGQYTRVKKTAELLEEKRFEYETQDAIRRWASTAYLDYDGDDLDASKSQLLKARAALAVLADLYTDEERRLYDNPAYQAIYSEYEQSFNKALVSLKIFNALRSAIAEETVNNENMFAEFQAWLHAMGSVPEYEAGYVSSADRSGWTIKDIITVQNGRLVFAIDGSMRLNGIDPNDAGALQSYFNAGKTLAGARHEISSFEIALMELGGRMESYFSNSKKSSQWGLARDYLVRTLIDTNGDIGFLQGQYLRAAPLMKGGSLARTLYKAGFWEQPEYIGDYVSSKQSSIRRAQQKAWDSLSDAEKADLEFYVILTLPVSGGYISGFSQHTVLKEFQTARDRAKNLYKEADDKVSRWWEGGFVFIEMRDINKAAYNRLKPPTEEIQKKVKAWEQGLLGNIGRIKNYASSYIISSVRLTTLEGAAAPGGNIGWNDISRVLAAVGGLKTEDLAALKAVWESMPSAGGTYANVLEALAQTAVWAGMERDRYKTALENQWRLDERELHEKETEYRTILENFYAGNADVQALSAAAQAAYGKDTAAWKNHFSNLEKTLIKDLENFPVYGSEYLADFSALGNEYISLVARTFAGRYNAEFTARESGWEAQRRDLAEKYRTWQETAALMIEKGREDWKAGTLKMEDAYKRWSANFVEEQKRVSAAWAEAYLAGLEDKEQWLEQAAAAADRASSEALLNAVGAEAERMARVMDTRDPLGIRGALPEAEKLLAELLNAPGLGNAGNIFKVLNGMGDFSTTAVKRGLGGAGTWDLGTVRAAAADLARKTNAELADREAAKLAFNARAAAAEALKSLTANIASANSNFRESMDQMYIVQGQWRKNGKRYLKDIIVGSTVFQPVITETKKVDGYVDYRMAPLALKTNLDDNYLAGLNAFAIRGLIENVYQEIEAARMEIFGDGGVQEIQNQSKVRYLGSGKFGVHIGYEPAMRPSGGSGGNRESMFYDQGSGELGRLMTEFLYWSVIDGKGMAKISVATWDKPLWDDRNSSFAAPSIRSSAEFIGQVAAAVVGAVAAVPTGGASAIGMMALMVGLSTTDDLVFNSLDVAYNYKSLDEAGFAFGKAVAISTVSTVSSGVFNGVAGVAGNGFLSAGNGLTGLATQSAAGLGKTAIQTLMTGAQTITTGLATSAINGITYSREDGLGYSTRVFADGVNGTMINALSSMTSNFTSGVLTNINSGLAGEKLAGFSGLNRSNIGTLNNTIGSLAGQGVQYALGGDFTLNVLNAGLFTDKKINTGLLELHLGRDGSPRMNIGTGGADVSSNTIASAVRGALVWDVNNRIDTYAAKNDFDAKVTLRAEYGMGDKVQKGQLWEILKGKTELNTGVNGDARGETVTAGGKRVVSLNGYRPGMSIEEQMALAITLGHEAYRDGVVTADNKLETREATLAHTEMALRILQEGYALNNANLAADIAAYLKSAGNMDAFNAYVDRTYDSSGDFWRIIKDDQGKVLKVLDDNDYTHVTIVEADGTEKTLPLAQGSVSAGLAAAVGNSMTKQQMNDTMVASGLWYEESKGWYASEDRGKYIPGSGEISSPNSGQVPLPNNGIQGRIMEVLDWTKNGITGILDSAKGVLSSISGTLKNNIASLFESSQKLEPPLNVKQTELQNFLSVPSGDSLSFYQTIMTEQIAKEYSLEENNGVYQCNQYVRDQIKGKYGDEVYNMIFEERSEVTNVMFESFKNNPNLERLDPNVYSIKAIQEMADKGTMVLMIYKNPNPGDSGHIAFVGNSNLTMFSVPTIPGLEGKKGTTLQSHQLVLVQAGTNTGVTSINYGTNKWYDEKNRQNLLKNNVYFYTVRGK